MILISADILTSYVFLKKSLPGLSFDLVLQKKDSSEENWFLDRTRLNGGLPVSHHTSNACTQTLVSSPPSPGFVLFCLWWILSSTKHPSLLLSSSCFSYRLLCFLCPPSLVAPGVTQSHWKLVHFQEKLCCSGMHMQNVSLLLGIICPPLTDPFLSFSHTTHLPLKIL